MDVSMKYRTQGSLPISSQHKAQYIPFPRIPEEPAPGSRGKAKLEAPVLKAPVLEAPVLKAPVLKAPVLEAPVLEAPALQSRSYEDQGNQQPPPRFQVPPTTRLEPQRFRRPADDPCKAIIETSPYYIYFKIVSTEDGRKSQEQDLKSVLSELVVIDQDMPRTAKYRHFRSYEQ